MRTKLSKRQSSLFKYREFASLLDDEELNELLLNNVSNQKYNQLSALKTPIDDCDSNADNLVDFKQLLGAGESAIKQDSLFQKLSLLMTPIED